MGLGSRIRSVRVDAHRTQRSVALASGLAAEYLSRLENDRVTPTTRTLLRVAEALRVPASVFFEGEPRLEAGDRCPVSSSGQCILDHLHTGRGVAVTQRATGYSARQLEVIRTCDYLVHHGSAEVQQTMATVLKSLLAMSESGGPPALPDRDACDGRVEPGAAK